MDSEKKSIIHSVGTTLEKNEPYKQTMEDFLKVFLNYQESEDKVLLTLYDGHSGVNVPQICMDKFPVMFGEAISAGKDLLNSFKDIFLEIDKGLESYEEEGSTAVVVYLCIEEGKRVIYVSNVGDSRAILVKKDKAIRLTYDHKAIDKEEQARCAKAGGIFFRNRLAGTMAVTRSLGDFSLKTNGGCGLVAEPTSKREVISEDDTYIILASDGVWDMINEADAHKLITDNSNLTAQELSDLFVKTAKEKNSRDNISCIVAKL